MPLQSHRQINVNTTGISELDRVLEGILAGDNIVWQVDNIDQYQQLIVPYAAAAQRNQRTLIYFRFARHAALLPEDFPATVVKLDTQEGFEPFIETIHATIEKSGRGAFYIFDCMSELAADWFSDQMLGNFFMLTCPFLYDMETVTYFALFRNHHSSRAIDPILATTQLFLNVYSHEQQLYVHPIKVEWRFSPHMKMLHRCSGEHVKAVTSSAEIADILKTQSWSGMGEVSQPGFWERVFLRGEDILARLEGQYCDNEDPEEIRVQLVRMCVSRDARILPLILQYFRLADVIDIRKRMIGSGLIGGKAVGMLLARAILRASAPKWQTLLETHDSFYVGSDVFYTFLVRNRIWQMRRKQYHCDTFRDGLDEARRSVEAGTFPDYIIHQLENMLDYFGQSPYIVRSSSLLEDNYGNSFAGKYESVFCPNQGSRRKRLHELLDAIRCVYSSTMSEDALGYRAERELLHQDEQMALLIQRVSGAMHGSNYYPHLAGVGFSFNPYVWSKYIDPKAGVLRLVFGLGTRAVDRADDDHTCIVALNAPLRRPYADTDELVRYTQRRVDYLDLAESSFASGKFTDLAATAEDIPLDLFTSKVGASNFRILSFERLLQNNEFIADMREMLTTLEAAYKYPVDIEFTINFIDAARYRINLVQCRPQQVQGSEMVHLPELQIQPEQQLLQTSCAVVGQSRVVAVRRIIYVVPSVYGELAEAQRYEIARIIGKLNRLEAKNQPRSLMLIGPGRWGTSSAALGIPVSFTEINRAGIICELAVMHANLVPDVSLGTHFLNELVEMNMLYLAVFPAQARDAVNESKLLAAPNRLIELIADAEPWQHCVHVIDADDLAPDSALLLHADCMKQHVTFFIDNAS